MQRGTISVQTENIFPIIKKFLYSDQEIFLRELVSNAVDATNKLKVLASKGEFTGELGNLSIEIILDAEAKTLTIRDKGIGMNEEEVLKYLNQVAFSSASEFMEKYKDEASIIGHFGLGFYSAFMVAKKVEVVTLSHKEKSQGVTWICEGNPSYELLENDKTARGTDIVLHISDDSAEFLSESRIGELLDKYCKFLPVPIQFGTRKETQKEGDTETEVEVPNIVNNPNPAWRKQPSELNDEDYLAFYRELHPFSPEPLFWIHLNIDYPFNLTGILYFPRMGGNQFELQQNKIQLYSNQVYVTDNVKEIVPDFLLLLHGVIDSPDIPLNVSRSYLQSDSNVRKITGYISRKVAEKLQELFNKDRPAFESKWADLGVFIKYGMLSDEKFYEKAQKFVLLKNTKGEYFTIEAYREQVKALQTDKNDKLVLLYTHSPDDHHVQVEAAEARGYDVLVFDHVIDNHFLQQLEYREQGLSFSRIDANTLDQLIQKDDAPDAVLSEEEQTTVKNLFSSVLGEQSMASVELKPLSPDEAPVQIVRPEFMRRMKEMQMLQGGANAFPDSYNVVVNANHPLIVNKLLKAETEEQKTELASYLYNLARLSQQMLRGPELSNFIRKTMNMLD
jgi:molecular chaperone HtpG